MTRKSAGPHLRPKGLEFPSIPSDSASEILEDRFARMSEGVLLEITPLPAARNQNAPKDYFIEQNGIRFAGRHLLVDLRGASNLDQPELIDKTLRESALAAGATILHSHFHHFEPNGGVSGVLVLAESHISIHTWPEHGYAALDVFMCGSCDPRKTLPVLEAVFSPERISVEEHQRGKIN